MYMETITQRLALGAGVPPQTVNGTNVFLECIKERRRPKTDGFAGLQVVELLELAQKSLDRGGQVEYLTPALETPPAALGLGLEGINSARLTLNGALAGVAGDLP